MFYTGFKIDSNVIRDLSMDGEDGMEIEVLWGYGCINQISRFRNTMSEGITDLVSGSEVLLAVMN